MSKRYPGGYLTASPVVPTATSAPGVWTLEQQYQANGAGNWPAAANYQINKSLRFRASATAYLSRTPASATNRKTWTWSGWVKRGILGTTQVIFGCYTGTNTDSGWTSLQFSSDSLVVNGWSTTWRNTSAVFRDPSAWYHIVLAVDTTQATGSNRIKLYVNGVQQTSFSTSADPTQNLDLAVNTASTHGLGDIVTYSSHYYCDCYMAEVNFIDGVAWTPSAFGTTDAYGIWQPIPFTGSYGTNGYYLPFTNTTSTTTLGYDSSGNGNNWTTNNISLTTGSTYDSMYDSPTNNSSTIANYCVANPLDKNSSVTVSDGNLKTSSSGTNQGIRGTFAPTSGKWYYEATLNSISGSAPMAGVANSTWALDYLGSSSGTCGYAADGAIYGGSGGSGSSATYTTNDVIGVAFDVDAQTVSFYKNGTAQKTGVVVTASQMFPALSMQTNAWTVNYGQQPFTYTAPTGFLPLNTYNLPNSNIMVGNQVMDATLWTGTGATNSIVNTAGFKPDFVWIKQRSGATWHNLYDSVRGTTKSLASNATDAEDTRATGLTAFNSNGFTVGSDNNANGSTNTYVGWQWQAGQGTTSSNTNGTITSTVSVNPTDGFSIVTFTGGSGNNTVGHGLGVTPNMVILKRRNSTSAWLVYDSALSNPATSFLELNTTSAVQTASPFWGASGMTSTTIGTSDNATINGATYVAYCWAEVAGFSKFGSYTGNGSTDGPFVYTGFRPKFVMIKCSSTGGAGYDWFMWDSSRNTYNVVDHAVWANLSDAENTTAMVDLVSNGFKIRLSSSAMNANGATFVYAAFAESPFKIARAR